MTSLPLVLDDEPIGIILSVGRQMLRPAKIWAYCWFTDEGGADDHTHRHLPEHVDSVGIEGRHQPALSVVAAVAASARSANRICQARQPRRVAVRSSRAHLPRLSST